ncbi:hypothetical protein CITRIK5_70430 [Citricoccus sp. K5]|nr:hypothetical protein CITRIK5_70430 [Citricoccus sp. K5]
MAGTAGRSIPGHRSKDCRRTEMLRRQRRPMSGDVKLSKARILWRFEPGPSEAAHPAAAPLWDRGPAPCGPASVHGRDLVR